MYCMGSSAMGLYLMAVEFRHLPRDFFVQVRERTKDGGASWLLRNTSSAVM
jgi:hypothetical protein